MSSMGLVFCLFVCLCLNIWGFFSSAERRLKSNECAEEKQTRIKKKKGRTSFSFLLMKREGREREIANVTNEQLCRLARLVKEIPVATSGEDLRLQSAEPFFKVQ